MEYGLVLSDPCMHCGMSIRIFFRKRFPDGQLESAIIHEEDWRQPVWKPVYGFEDSLRIQESNERERGTSPSK